MGSDREALLHASCERRGEAWQRWGELEADVLGHLINPSFMGGPRWPALRQAFRVARKGGALLLASDGLSDPEGEGPDDVNGLGLEVYCVSSDPIEKIPGSWLFDLVWQASQTAADRGDLADLLEQYGVMSTELYDVGIPESARGRFVNEEGRVGVMLGLPHPTIPHVIDGPLSPIRLVNAKLLTLEELGYAAAQKEAGRRELARRFGAEGPISSLARASVIP